MPGTTIRKDVFEELYRRYRPGVVRCCRRILGNVADADDVAHDVFEKLLQHPELIDRGAECMNWLVRVSINHSINHANKFKRRGELLRDRSEQLRPQTPAEFDPALLHELDMCHELLRLVGRETQAIVICRYLLDMTHEQIREVLGVSRTTSTKRLDQFTSRAKKHLRRMQQS